MQKGAVSRCCCPGVPAPTGFWGRRDEIVSFAILCPSLTWGGKCQASSWESCAECPAHLPGSATGREGERGEPERNWKCFAPLGTALLQGPGSLHDPKIGLFQKEMRD